MVIAKELLDVLVCPEDRAKLTYTENSLKCEKCGKTYPVKEGIPVFV